ncbi:MAG: ABC transporter ATP-binding protein [Bacteroidota bacterium]
MKDLKFLNKYFYKYRYRLLLGTLFVIASNIFAILPAQVIREAFNLVKDTIDLYHLFEGSVLDNQLYSVFGESVVIAGVAILVFALIRGIFLFFMRQTIIVMSRRIEFDLKNEIYNHYQSLPLSFYRKNSTGDLIARISEDVNKVRMYVGPAIMYGINLLSLFLLVIPYMISVNTRLSLYALIPLPLLSISIYYVNNIINRRSREIQESLSDLSTFVQESFSGIRVIKAFARESDTSRSFARQSDNYKGKSIRLAFVHALFYPLMLFLIGLSTVLTVFIGGAEVITGELTTGNIAEFIIYVNLLTWPVTSLGWVTSIVQQASASQRRINQFLETKNDIISQKDLSREISGQIEFNNIDFVYPDSGIHAVKKVSFTVSPGESIAIIGTTGSGKSTIANLTCRLYDTTSGNITIDGIDIKDYSLSSLRRQIGYVPQDVFLFSDTIGANISFGIDEKIDEEGIIKAAEDADLLENIERFPKGFETVLGERGITLSGGQKQRVSIARAVARKPKILILDDCLSAVDTKTENTILNSMKRIMKGKTTMIISHRVSSAKLAEQIIVLDNGEIVEQGTHDELLEKGGTYSELYEKQLQSEEVLED